jgi:hypothetical protein
MKQVYKKLKELIGPETKIFSMIQLFIIIYLGFFFIWLILSLGCLIEADAKNIYFEEYCGGDVMTSIARSIIYKPLYNFMLK